MAQPLNDAQVQQVREMIQQSSEVSLNRATGKASQRLEVTSNALIAEGRIFNEQFGRQREEQQRMLGEMSENQKQHVEQLQLFESQRAQLQADMALKEQQVLNLNSRIVEHGKMKDQIIGDIDLYI